LIETYRDAVLAIKNAVLTSRYKAAASANADQLTLYYSIGKFVSDNTRSDRWGSGAIEAISLQLQEEMPGLRGFSATNIKYMRRFYEEWEGIIQSNRQLTADDLINIDAGIVIRQLPTDELNAIDKEAFLKIGFTHHIEIILPKFPRKNYTYTCSILKL
jgi:hypothetical protein